MVHSFYTKEARSLQDKFLSRGLADQLLATRRHLEFSESDRNIIERAPFFSWQHHRRMAILIAQ